MKALKIFVILVALFSICILQTEAAIRISPNRFEFSAKPESNLINGSFMVQASKNETIRFKVYPEYFEISEAGTMVTDFKNPNKMNNTLLKNIRFNPAEFTLTSGIPQKVRFTISNLNSMSNGESRVALFLEDAKTRQQALSASDSKAAAYLVLKTRVGIPIYVEKGEITKAGAIENLDVEKLNDKYFCMVNVKSSGNSKIRVGGTAQIIKDKDLISEFPIENSPIQGGSTGKVIGNIPLENLNPEEEYRLKVILAFRDQKDKLQYLTTESNFKLVNVLKKQSI